MIHQMLKLAQPVFSMADGFSSSGGAEGDGGDGAPASETIANAGGGDISAYAPEGLPEHLRGASDHETIDKLFKANQGFREQDAQRGPVAKNVDELAFEFSEKLAPHFSEQDDPAVQSFKQATVEMGLPTKVAQELMEKTLGPLIESGLVAQPYSVDNEFKQLGEKLSLGREGIAKAVTEAHGFAQGLGAQLRDVPDAHRDAVADRIMELADDHVGVMALNALRARMGEGGIKIEGRSAGTAMSAQELDALANDPRIYPDSGTFDPMLRAKYDEELKRQHNG